jgi:YVTN family beta-propeller protein
MKPSIISAILFLSAVFLGCSIIDNSHQAGSNRETIEMPYNRILKPAGKLILFGDSTLENHALDIALSPDKKHIAVEERYSIVIIDATTNSVVYTFPVRRKLNSICTYSGIKWVDLNGRSTIFFSVRNMVVKAEWNGRKLKAIKTYRFLPEKGAHASIPNDIEIEKAGNTFTAYVVLNGNDKLVKFDINSGKIIWTKHTGIAPYGITMAAGKLYVSNWSGSVPGKYVKHKAGVPYGWGKTVAYVDSLTGAVSSGSVSVFDPASGKLINEIKTGLHPNDITASPEGKYVYVANGNSDCISVISTTSDEVVETIPVRLMQKNNPYFGDTPTGLVLNKAGTILHVSLGMDNAVAVVELGNNVSVNGKNSKTKIAGFIPTGAYPAGIAIDEKRGRIYTADIEGIGARLTAEKEHSGFKTTIKGKRISTSGAFNSHRMLAAVSVIDIPTDEQLETYTRTVEKTNRLNRLQMSTLLPRDGTEPVPVPERVGEPSVFKHVIYIIKENRTYDQILGDVKKGDGMAKLCAFGKEVTPNIHKLVSDYVLLDRYEASGKCSSEGHVWTDASIVTDYTERNVRAWFRSYTHVLYDAMAYPKSGFIWDNALDHGKSVRIYGEASVPRNYGNKKWRDIYKAFMKGKHIPFKNLTTIDRVRGILAPAYPAYDSHNFPDIMRADAFMKELKEFEKMDGDKLPALMILALPNDHTAGTAQGYPTPRAFVADNDLALGRIVEAVSKSRFWKNTVIFVTEDDSQNGWDHISAYRTVGMVISPYSRTGRTISTNYNQTSMVRTIEQILGLPPMNIADATAKPMFDVFDDAPDLTPYKHLKNNIPLNEMNPLKSALAGKDLIYAMESERLVQKGIDSGEDVLLNKIIWNAVKNGEDYPEKYAGFDEDDDDD